MNGPDGSQITNSPEPRKEQNITRTAQMIGLAAIASTVVMMLVFLAFSAPNYARADHGIDNRQGTLTTQYMTNTISQTGSLDATIACLTPYPDNARYFYYYSLGVPDRTGIYAEEQGDTDRRRHRVMVPDSYRRTEELTIRYQAFTFVLYQSDDDEWHYGTCTTRIWDIVVYANPDHAPDSTPDPDPRGYIHRHHPDSGFQTAGRLMKEARAERINRNQKAGHGPPWIWCEADSMPTFEEARHDADVSDHCNP